MGGIHLGGDVESAFGRQVADEPGEGGLRGRWRSACGHQGRLLVEGGTAAAVKRYRQAAVGLRVELEGSELRIRDRLRRHERGKGIHPARPHEGGAGEWRGKERARRKDRRQGDNEGREGCRARESIKGNDDRRGESEPEQAQTGTRPDCNRLGADERDLQPGAQHRCEETEQREKERGNRTPRPRQEQREEGEQGERREQYRQDDRARDIRKSEHLAGRNPAVQVGIRHAKGELPTGGRARRDRDTRLRKPPQDVSPADLRDHQRHEECDRRNDQSEQARDAARAGHHERQPAQHQRRNKDRSGCRDSGEHQGSGRGGRPAATGVEHRSHQPRQQEVREHGTQLAVDHRRQQRRRKRPEQCGNRRRPGALGEPDRRPPCAEGSQREGNQVQHDDAERRSPVRERCYEGEEGRERIRRADETAAGLVPSIADLRPHLTDRPRKWRKTAAGESLGSEQRAEGDDANERSEKHRPGAAAGEKSDSGPGGRGAGDNRGLPLLGAELAGIRNRDAEGGDGRPADLLRPAQVTP